MLSEENIKIKKKDTRNLKICVANCGNYSKKYRNLNLYVASSFEDTVKYETIFRCTKNRFHILPKLFQHTMDIFLYVNN